MPSVASISELPLFAALSPAQISDVESRMRRRDFTPQQTIVREGGPGDAAFLVVSGLVAVRHKDPNSGVEFTLAELGAGQMFGEMALITGKARAASVVSLEQTSCAVLERAEFDRALEDHPGIALALARVIAERLEAANRSAGIDFISLARLKIDPRVLTLLPAPMVNAHRCVPISFINNRLTLAMTDPNNIVALDDVRRILKGVVIEPAAVAEEDFRRFMGTVPGKWGEKVVMRILDKSNTQLGLEKLISHAPTLALMRDIIQQPYGIIYVTGPTGSGKTTTLYSALAEINDPGVNISTAEDPIEYDLPGITQIQANPAINLTFASILRAFRGRIRTSCWLARHATRKRRTRRSRRRSPGISCSPRCTPTARRSRSRVSARWGSSRSWSRRRRSASSRSGSRGGCARTARSRYEADAETAASSDCARGRGSTAPAAARLAAARVSRGASGSTK